MKLLKKMFNWLFKPNEVNYVHYIKNKEGLPKPLEGDEEREAIDLLMKGDETARKRLIVHNLRLVVYIAKRYEVSPSEMEDLISIGTIGLIKAVNTYKSDKNIKLVTYASRCIENEILMFLRKKSKSRKEISLDEPLNVDYDGNELLLGDIIGTQSDLVEKAFERNENKRILLKAIATLNDREKMILQMRYGIGENEATQKDIAEKLGISQSYISRLEKRILMQLKMTLTSSKNK